MLQPIMPPVLVVSPIWLFQQLTPKLSILGWLVGLLQRQAYYSSLASYPMIVRVSSPTGVRLKFQKPYLPSSLDKNFACFLSLRGGFHLPVSSNTVQVLHLAQRQPTVTSVASTAVVSQASTHTQVDVHVAHYTIYTIYVYSKNYFSDDHFFLYSLCPNLEGIKDALFYKFRRPAIGQICSAVCTNKGGHKERTA